MAKGFWKRQKSGAKGYTDLVETTKPTEPLTLDPTLSQTVTYGKRCGETAEVVFTHRAQNVRQVIVDEEGQIRNFPGVKLTERLMRALEDSVLPAPVVHYRTEFRLGTDGRVRMLWQVQPDGRYWADEDGFGAAHDPEIFLCAWLDTNGCFMGPFQVYSIGVEKLYDGE